MSIEIDLHYILNSLFSLFTPKNNNENYISDIRVDSWHCKGGFDAILKLWVDI